MKQFRVTLAIAGMVGLLSFTAVAQIRIKPIGSYATGIFDESAAEVAAYDPQTKQLFSVNKRNATVDVLDLSHPVYPTFLFAIDVSPYGRQPNSVAVHGRKVAVAVEPDVKTDPGMVVFFDTHGRFRSAVTVGALPDMITFTPNGRKLLVANEGEPDEAYTIDPEGSVSIINISDDDDGGDDDDDNTGRVTQADVVTATFTAFTRDTIDPNIRIVGPNNPTVAQDLEPEYITVSHDSRTAWVTLQENNAIAILDVRCGVFTELVALGFKDHSQPYNGLDASDRDGAINIANWPVLGMYQPDTIASYRVGGRTYLVTANEGDGRDYAGFSEETRVSDLTLDPVAFPNAAELQQAQNLGRLTVSSATGDPDGDGDFDELHVFGTRSFSIWTERGELVFDSADDFERITAAVLPADFNSTNNANGSRDTRSDNKGPEPEGVALGKVFGRTYAFIGLERIGGIMVYDVSNPFLPRFVQYINNRDFSGDPRAGTAGDLGPEGLIFIREEDSPNGKPLLVVSNTVSGTITLYEIARVREGF